MSANLEASRSAAISREVSNPNDHQRKTLKSRLAIWLAAHPWHEQIRALALFEITYYFAYRYGMAFTNAHPAPLWFPDSVLLVALLVTPKNRWWLFIAAQVPIRLLVAVPDGAPACFGRSAVRILFASVS